MKGNSQSGAVFYYILLAVVLVAAISYAVSSGNRAAVGTLSADQARVAANEIIEYGNTVANAVQKLKLRGCSDTEISFENAVLPHNYTNPNAPSDNSCHVFDLSGGNINLQNNLSGMDRPYIGFTGLYAVEGFGDITESELTFIVSVQPEVCLEINRRYNIPTEANGEAPIRDFMNGPRMTENPSSPEMFQGNYSVSMALSSGVGPVTDTWTSKPTGCFQVPVSGLVPGPYVYTVLSAR